MIIDRTAEAQELLKDYDWNFSFTRAEFGGHGTLEAYSSYPVSESSFEDALMHYIEARLMDGQDKLFFPADALTYVNTLAFPVYAFQHEDKYLFESRYTLT